MGRGGVVPSVDSILSVASRNVVPSLEASSVTTVLLVLVATDLVRCVSHTFTACISSMAIARTFPPTSNDAANINA